MFIFFTHNFNYIAFYLILCFAVSLQAYRWWNAAYFTMFAIGMVATPLVSGTILLIVQARRKALPTT